jgi:hypothetical protein
MTEREGWTLSMVRVTVTDRCWDCPHLQEVSRGEGTGRES